MTKFIEITDRKYGNKMLINTSQIMYVCDGGRAVIRYSDNGEWGIVHCEETYEAVKELLEVE